jgi:hypothetical protein
MTEQSEFQKDRASHRQEAALKALQVAAAQMLEGLGGVSEGEGEFDKVSLSLGSPGSRLAAPGTYPNAPVFRIGWDILGAMVDRMGSLQEYVAVMSDALAFMDRHGGAGSQLLVECDDLSLVLAELSALWGGAVADMLGHPRPESASDRLEQFQQFQGSLPWREQAEEVLQRALHHEQFWAISESAEEEQSQ